MKASSIRNYGTINCFLIRTEEKKKKVFSKHFSGAFINHEKGRVGCLKGLNGADCDKWGSETKRQRSPSESRRKQNEE